jgi:hypothetical protein
VIKQSELKPSNHLEDSNLLENNVGKLKPTDFIMTSIIGIPKGSG